MKDHEERIRKLEKKAKFNSVNKEKKKHGKNNFFNRHKYNLLVIVVAVIAGLILITAIINLFSGKNIFSFPWEVGVNTSSSGGGVTSSTSSSGGGVTSSTSSSGGGATSNTSSSGGTNSSSSGLTAVESGTSINPIDEINKLIKNLPALKENFNTCKNKITSETGSSFYSHIILLGIYKEYNDSSINNKETELKNIINISEKNKKDCIPITAVGKKLKAMEKMDSAKTLFIDHDEYIKFYDKVSFFLGVSQATYTTAYRKIPLSNAFENIADKEKFKKEVDKLIGIMKEKLSKPTTLQIK